MTYLVSMLTWYKYGDGMKRIQRLNDAASMQVQLVKSLPLRSVKRSPSFIFQPAYSMRY